MNIYVLIDDKGKEKGVRTYLAKDEKIFREMNEKGFGVYFAVNQFDSERKTEKVKKLRYVYADCDIAKKNDGQTREEKQAKKEILFQALLKYLEPTLVIDTSNGLQPLWELEDKSVSEENKEDYVRILKGIVNWSKNYGSLGDNVYDISRILRLPNYYHQKEEPYLCEVLHQSNKKYSYRELLQKFPYEKEVKTTHTQTQNLGVIDQKIQDLDFQELVIRAFNSVGRKAEFDKTGRLILDDRLTGTFQGRKGDKQYLASSSHEPFAGNKITVIADILSVSNKEARKWIIDEYKISYQQLVTQKKVTEQLQQIKQKPKEKKKKRYTWGTRYLDTHLAIIKPTNFIVVAAKRSSGKTVYSFDMAWKNALLGHKVLYISLEMDTDDILDDFGRKYAGITIEEEYDDKIPPFKLEAYERKKKELLDQPNLTVEGIRRNGDIQWETIVAVIDTHPDVDMIFLDNLDLIAGQEREDENKRQRRIITNIMSFTAERQVPLILIHHYRKSSQQKDHGMDELAGTGKIADGADRVIKITRVVDPEATYPEKYKSIISLQKGRGYPEHSCSIYFIKGTFVDTPPPNPEEEARDFARIANSINTKI